MKRLAIVLGLLVGVGAAVFVARAGRRPAESSSARVDEMFAQWNRPDSPGCSVGVSRDGLTVHERGYGMANLELDVPITPASAFEAASISKQFTAMSIMLLAQRGRLSLEDQVRKYLPELPDHGTPLTIRHLLNHTSGLRDVFLLLELSAPQDDGGDRNDLLLELLARQRSLNSQPGMESQYNNGGYVLLAIVVKRVSGQSLAAFAHANIFTPLGMTSTRFMDDPEALMPNRAANYRREAGTWRFVPDGTARGAVGNSGLWTTTRDLLRWEHNFAQVQVGTEALLKEMQTPAVLPGGKPAEWGLGFQIGEHRGSTFVGHGGGDRGIDNYVAWYPRQRLAIAVLCNSDEAGSYHLTQRIADVYIGGAPAEPAAASAAPLPAAGALSIQQLEGKAGLYRETGGDTFVRFFVRDGQLRGALGTGTGESFQLSAVGESRFTVPGTPFAVEFEPASGRARGLRSFIDRTQNGVFERVEPFTPSSAQLRAYAGEYRSAELNVVWTITERDAGLVIRRPGKADTVAEPLATDMFTTIGDFMKFSRDPGGAISGLTLVSTGVRSLSFERVNR